MDLCSDWAHVKLLCTEVGWICVQIGHMSNCCARKLDGSVFRLGACQIAVHGSWMDLCSDWAHVKLLCTGSWMDPCSDWAHVKLLCTEVGWICVQIGHMSNCCAWKLDGSVFRLGASSHIALQGVIRPLKTNHDY